MAVLTIVQPGQKLPTLGKVCGDFADWMINGIGAPPGSVARIYPHLGNQLPPVESVSALLVTGSGAMVTDNDKWLERLTVWLRRMVSAEVPVLGICFGHQLLAHALK